MKTKTYDDFVDAMERGLSAAFIASTPEMAKEFLAAALRARIEGFDSQQYAASSWGVSEPTISYIVRGRMERFSLGFLLELLIKSGAKVEVAIS